jgi:D-xylose transport system permease protein
VAPIQGDLKSGTPGEITAGVNTDVDLTAATGGADDDVPPELLAQSLGEYFRGWWQRIKSGDSGLLPVLVAMVIVAIAFELITPENAFLRPSNLVYIFGLSTVYMVLAIAEIVILLLGEIDLSIGAVALMGGTIAYKLVQQPSPNWPWWAAIATSLVCCGVIGALQGTLVSRLKIPSFVVTLAGFLLFSGMLIVILGGADGSLGLSSVDPNQSVLYNLVQGTIDPVVSWVIAAVVVVGFGALIWFRGSSRRRSGLVAPPASLAAIRIALIAAVAVAVLAICTVNRGGVFATIEGLPWVIPVVFVIVALWTLLLQRTRFGRYVYAIGGNPEAARRAGVRLPVIRTWCFVLCSATAGFAGILLGSFYYGQYSTNVGDPGQLVLYSVAAAVIGGTSLFGGRGKPIHGVLGGLLIGGIAYGVSLMNLGQLSIPLEYILPGGVLLLAVLVDVVSRRGARTGSVARV